MLLLRSIGVGARNMVLVSGSVVLRIGREAIGPLVALDRGLFWGIGGVSLSPVSMR